MKQSRICNRSQYCNALIYQSFRDLLFCKIILKELNEGKSNLLPIHYDSILEMIPRILERILKAYLVDQMPDKNFEEKKIKKFSHDFLKLFLAIKEKNNKLFDKIADKVSEIFPLYANLTKAFYRKNKDFFPKYYQNNLETLSKDDAKMWSLCFFSILSESAFSETRYPYLHNNKLITKLTRFFKEDLIENINDPDQKKRLLADLKRLHKEMEKSIYCDIPDISLIPDMARWIIFFDTTEMIYKLILKEIKEDHKRDIKVFFANHEGFLDSYGLDTSLNSINFADHYLKEILN
jgi:hypothetical protein